MSGINKKLIFNAFAMNTPVHLSPGQWKDPEDTSTSFQDLEHWTELAKVLEEGKFNALFIADVLGAYDVHNGNKDSAVRTGAQFPIHSPELIVPAMAAVTKNLAFGITQSTSYEHPFNVARRFSTLDHLTKGRVAINIVTSYLDSAARNHGLPEQIDHDERYKRADEFMDVLYKLWESSWSDNAKTLDKEKDQYYDPALVHEINHEGEYFKCAGPHITEPSIQRTPLVFQAGSSGPGQEFAAKHSEAVFLWGSDVNHLAKKVKSLRDLSEKLGRGRDGIKAIAGANVIVAETDELAQKKFEDLRANATKEGALVLLGGWTGNDFGKFTEDDELRLVQSNAIKSTVETYAQRYNDKDSKWTKSKLATHASVGGVHPNIVGSPSTVADIIEEWIKIGDIDGFNFGYATKPGTFIDLVKYVFPELRRRGLHWDDYPSSNDGRANLTARESYFGPGNKRLPENHYGNKFKYENVH
ncbi:Nitrilotriacetate monooxygenase component A/pristinamycin IIA synthase subunit A [Wallemia mellicola]|uniref:Nitrilotriacetate monooxygenase component A/pristinamycin IIA synthase subunit A n=1 Tax=Wallemia mellicola TaxID=1708541 RepID=A0AB38MT95_9BASI|nr:Nitrilotriacetate monooxygenase component A/pristinamycin IIA synthase subunit A [Wallemia mellicola]